MKPGAWTEFRQLFAERLIRWAFDLMPASHPHSLIWARHLGAASGEIADKLEQQRVLER